MEVKIARSFVKDLKMVPKPIQQLTQQLIEKLLAAATLQESGVDYTKLEGQKKGEQYYCIRVGDWRIGIEYDHPEVIILRILARGTIYKKFPPQ